MKKQNRGFSLVELLIVVVIIGVIAAMAIPNLLAARRAANEASSIRSLRTISSAQAVYQSTAGNRNYGTAAQLYAASLIDATVAAANNVNVGGNPVTNTAKGGYRFSTVVTAYVPATGVQATYLISSIPSMSTGATQTGTKRYCLTERGQLKASTATLASHFTYANCNSGTAFVP